MMERRAQVTEHTLERQCPGSATYHSRKEPAQSWKGQEKSGIWVNGKMTIRPKVLVGYGHKHCLPQGQ